MSKENTGGIVVSPRPSWLSLIRIHNLVQPSNFSEHEVEADTLPKCEEPDRFEFVYKEMVVFTLGKGFRSWSIERMRPVEDGWTVL